MRWTFNLLYINECLSLSRLLCVRVIINQYVRMMMHVCERVYYVNKCVCVFVNVFTFLSNCVTFVK